MRSTNRLMFLYGMTLFGSFLSMISTFNYIESAFNTFLGLAMALGLRTVFMFLAGKIGPSLFNKFSLNKVIIASEVLGILGTLALLFGFYSSKIYFVLFGIIFLGLPSGLLGQGIILLYKETLNDDNFKTMSANLSIMLGIILIITGLISPLLIEKVGMNSILIFDLITYIVILAALSFMPFKTFRKKQEKRDLAAEKSLSNLKHYNKWSPYLLGFPTLILMGLIPLLAGDSNLQSFFSPSQQNILLAAWTFEGYGSILAGQLYKIKKIESFLFMIASLSCLPIFLSLYFHYDILLMISLLILSFSYSFSFMKTRTDLLLRYPHLSHKISGECISMRSLFCTLSPFVILYLKDFLDFKITLLIFFITQIIFYGISVFKNKIHIESLYEKA